LPSLSGKNPFLERIEYIDEQYYLRAEVLLRTHAIDDAEVQWRTLNSFRLRKEAWPQ
jgi:hypothetical protein